MRFAGNALAAREARRCLVEELERIDVSPGLRSDALLLASELINNAIEHGTRHGGQCELSCALFNGRLVITVVDSARGGGAPHVLSPHDERPAGRGLYLVDRLADSWAERIVDGRREVAFTLRLTHRASPFSNGDHR